MQIAALAGGVGASKLLWGLYRAPEVQANPQNLTIIVNTGDDLEMHGLTICPDLDIVTYTLAGLVNPATGWGIDQDTFATLEFLGKYGRQTWFNLGDRDLATHIHRTDLLRHGSTLARCADVIRTALGVRSRILPMSNDRVRTQIETSQGTLPFQDYLVKHRAAPKISGVRFEGIDSARPAAGVLEALDKADAIIICPSNPLISIGPILAVRGVREVLVHRRARVIAVCPIVGGASLKGPSDKMMDDLGLEVSAAGVAHLYRDIASTLVIDEVDAGQRDAIEKAGLSVEVTQTVMRTDEEKERLAQFVLGVARKAGVAAHA